MTLLTGGLCRCGLCGAALVSAGHEICRAYKHPGTPVPVPELQETITTTTAAEGSWTWTFTPETDRYFGLVTDAADDPFCK